MTAPKKEKFIKNPPEYIEWEYFLRQLQIGGREKELILRKLFKIKR